MNFFQHIQCFYFEHDVPLPMARNLAEKIHTHKLLWGDPQKENPLGILNVPVKTNRVLINAVAARLGLPITY